MSLESLEERIQKLEDIEEIKKLKHRYCSLCDANYNANALAELFIEDAVWDGQERGRNDGRE
ncbi:MAG: nuclear transport factor 2 family protein, partial [Chloroflexota bacterium]|nr:nuclear transport factor 2 family protein [Chloroflexota bacterium]